MAITLSFNEYQELVEQAPIMIWRSNREKLCDYFNVRWLLFTGRSFEQEYGNGWTEGVHPDDFQKCLEIYTSSFDKREIFEMRYRLKRHDGQYRWIFDRGVPFFDSAKNFMGYIGSCVDIHETVLAEEHNQQINAEKLRELTSLLPICAWCKKIRDAQGEWVDLEEYVRTHKKQKITHSICASCKDKHF